MMYDVVDEDGIRTHCDSCGGLGAQVEVFPWGLARLVCQQGHRWVTRPVPGSAAGASQQPPAGQGSGDE